MTRTSGLVWICSGAAFLGSIQSAKADTYPVILQGKVTMEDGSPPPFTVSIERSCSDALGGTPGPLTNKKGEWVWRIEIDAFASRACVFRATHPGYTSTAVDASNLNVTSHNTTMTVQPIVLLSAAADPYTMKFSQDNIPGKARGSVDKAMKAVDGRNYEEAARLLKEAVASAPKFAQGWHALGVIEDRLDKQAEARDAFAHAIEADPKMLPAYVTLVRSCLKAKDWECASKNADSLIKVDTKRLYPEIYLHRAVALYGLKDLAGALQSVDEARRLDTGHKRPRAEYVEGRILEAKGDAAGAREHISKYIELDPNTPDAELVRAHLANLGQAGSTAIEPELELL
jgi:Tfp pilus assembly protein PilF